MSDLNKVFVVPFEMEKHPDADSLSLVKIEGYTCVVRTEDWVGETRAAYIPPDNVVDITRPEFKFLDSGIVGRTTERIKARRFRGIMSQGLLVPIPMEIMRQGLLVPIPTDECYRNAPEYKFNIGDDVTEYFGVTRYVSLEDLKLAAGESTSGPPTPGIHYDIESWFKYRRAIPEGTEIILTEKLHGTNARFTFQEGEMHVASRSNYRKKEVGNLYWKALEENPWIENFCRKYEGVVLYGEIFGWVQTLKYGAKPGQIHFRAFDVYDNGQFWDWEKFYKRITHGISSEGYDLDFANRIVPIIYRGLCSNEIIETHMNGQSIFFPGHIREGVVIKPVVEMSDLRLGRVILKAVSPAYLEKAK